MNSRNHKPPRLATRILLSFLRDDLAEEVAGDLEEKFHIVVKKRSSLRAKVNYWYQVLNYVRPFAIRKKSKHRIINPHDMYRSYFKTAYRNLLNNRLHSFLNITGLSAGMAVSITIGLWIWDELSFNKSIPDSERVSQVIQNVTNNGEVQTWRSVPWPLAEEIRKNYGGDFEHVALMTGLNEHLLTVSEKKVKSWGLYAEPSLPDILSLKMIAGTRSALKDPSAIIISMSAAKNFFGQADPLYKTLTIGENFTARVAGVYEDLPENSFFRDLHFVAPWEGLVSHSPWINNIEDPWRPNAFVLLVKLHAQADVAAASARIRDAKLKKVNAELAKKEPRLFLNPMNRWHLYGEFRNGKNVGGRIQYVWLFGIVGAFVLLMACINFMNLSTARSEKRAKEIGIRKAIGSLRSQLLSQFFSESILTATLSFVLAVLLVQLSLPFFNQVSDKQMQIPWGDPIFWAIGITFTFITGVVAGSYPALYLSSLRPGGSGRGISKPGMSALLPRRVLVVLQFTVSVVLIIGTAVVFRQIQYAKNRPLGYDTNGLVAFPMENDHIHKHFDAVADDLLRSGYVLSIAEAAAPTTERWSSSSGFDWNGKDPNLSVDFPTFSISHDYGKTIGWELVKGRDFSRDFLSDSLAMIINASAAAYMGFKEPVGETVRWFGTSFHIVGVVKDLVINSPYEPASPVIYHLAADANNFVIARLNPAKSPVESISAIGEVFRKFNPDQPFEYLFMDDEFEKKFGNEERVGTLAGYFSSLAILISVLGIFGLASFVAEQRTKEIGIRKVLGASLVGLWGMLSKEFLILVLIACVLAVPAGWYFMQLWLDKYTYHTAIPWWVFASSIATALCVTLLTVSFQAIKAARMNPVKSLRSE